MRKKPEKSIERNILDYFGLFSGDDPETTLDEAKEIYYEVERKLYSRRKRELEKDKK